MISKVTQHAVDRYVHRSGCKSFESSVNKLLKKANSGIPIGNHQFYQGGWIVVIKKSVVRTCFKPHTKSQQLAVLKAHTFKYKP